MRPNRPIETDLRKRASPARSAAHGRRYPDVRDPKDRNADRHSQLASPREVSMGFLEGLFGRPNIEKLKRKSNVKGLISALGHARSEVSEKAAGALGELGDRRAVEPLMAILEDQERESVHEEVAKALGRLGDSRAVEALVRALKHRYPSVRDAAAESLGNLGDPRAIQPLIVVLQNLTFIGSKAVARALGRLGAGALEPLLASLRHKEKEVREFAARALAELADPGSVEQLIDALKDDYLVQQQAARALQRLRDPRAAEPLLAVLTEGALPAIADALAAIGGERVNRALAENWLHRASFANEHWEVSTLRTAISTLGRLRDPRAVRPLIETLERDSLKDVQEAAAEALGCIGGPESERALAEYRSGKK